MSQIRKKEGEGFTHLDGDLIYNNTMIRKLTRFKKDYNIIILWPQNNSESNLGPPIHCNDLKL